MVEEVERLLESDHIHSYEVSRRGLEQTSGRAPGATYRLPGLELNLYSVERNLEELNHPFRPSGSIILEVSSESYSRYYTASQDDFEVIDSFLMNLVDSAGDGYYKEIRPP
ncbi:MAG: hypothetical protein ABEJ98_02490 [Candidatus Nanohaloarchaea archaeon]